MPFISIIFYILNFIANIIKQNSPFIMDNNRSLLAISKISQPMERTPTESRIIERKQIQKRLQGLSLKQYERINKNLLRQKDKLKDEVTNLTQKVNKLIESKKIQTTHKRNPLIEEQILKLKKQLEIKYQEMKDLKWEIKQQTDKNFVEEISTNMKDKKNQLTVIQKEIQLFTVQKNKLIELFRENQIDFQQYLPTKDLTQQVENLREQNKGIKKKATDLSIKIKENQKLAKEALTKISMLKDKNIVDGTFNQGLNKNNRIKSLSVLSKPQSARRSSNDSNELKNLQREVSILKKKKIDLQNEYSTDKVSKQSAKSKLQSQIRQLLQHHKKLFKRRVRELTQLNYYEKKEADMLLQKKLQSQKVIVPTIQRSMQTEIIIKKQYRKDWIGERQGVEFDDGDLVHFKESCLIKSITVFRTNDHIVFIRFGYESVQNKYKYETKLPFDKEALKKVEGKRVVSKSNGFLLNLSLSITKNIITRVQSLWSDGDSSVQGWETDESDKFRFDILEKQKPISFFGSVVPHVKGSYALESLGCQILQTQEAHN